jgi:hypothetical protein
MTTRSSSAASRTQMISQSSDGSRRGIPQSRHPNERRCTALSPEPGSNNPQGTETDVLLEDGTWVWCQVVGPQGPLCDISSAQPKCPSYR